MTLLGEASAIYVGAVAASAVYLGDVKVWPVALPPLTAVGTTYRLDVNWPLSALAGKVSPITVTLEQSYRDYAAAHPLESVQTFDSAGAFINVFAPGTLVGVVDLLDQGAPLVLASRQDGAFELRAASLAHAQDDGTDMMIWDQYKEALRSGSPWILQIVCSPLFRSKTGSCRVVDAAGTQIGVDPYGSDPVGPDVTVEQWIAAADAGWARLTHTGLGWSFYLDWEGRT
jgi:hypothetical protein